MTEEPIGGYNDCPLCGGRGWVFNSNPARENPERGPCPCCEIRTKDKQENAGRKPMKYYQLPVEIEAVQWTGENHREVVQFCVGRSVLFENNTVLCGSVTEAAKVGNWITWREGRINIVDAQEFAAHFTASKPAPPTKAKEVVWRDAPFPGEHEYQALYLPNGRSGFIAEARRLDRDRLPIFIWQVYSFEGDPRRMFGY